MHRREFIVLLGGTAATWPLTARTDQLRLIGVLSGFSEEEMRPVLDAFRSRLNELGWIEGRNITIDARLGAGDYARLAEDAGTLVGRKPDVIVAMGTPGLTAIRQHTHSVSVVFALVADPVSAGLVESLARPGGRATGFTNFEFSIGGKWLELLKGICPSVTHVTVISNPANPATGKLAQFIGQAGRSAAIDITTASVRGSSEIEAAVITTAQEPESGLIVLPDSLIIVNSELIIALAERYCLPAVYPFRSFAAKGGLLTYGLDIPEVYRQAAGYVDRILRGEKPAELPVQAPTKFELVINLKTARTIGLIVPPSLLAAADEVIE